MHFADNKPIALPRQPKDLVLLLDFDGTLSPIAPRPEDAHIAPENPALLSRLARMIGRVAIVSGRSEAFLRTQIPDPLVTCIGGYGRPPVSPSRVDALAKEIATHIPGSVTIEIKPSSLTLHFRSCPDLGDSVTRAAEAFAEQKHLLLEHAKMSVELSFSGGIDKGTVARELVNTATHALYVGDDVGDISAFRTLKELSTVVTTLVAVASQETPAELIACADLTVQGTDGVTRLLRWLTSAWNQPGATG